jgi:hypothetical protein
MLLFYNIFDIPKLVRYNCVAMLDSLLSWSLSVLSNAVDPVEFTNCFRFVNNINGLPDRIKELFGKQNQDTRYHTVLPTADALIVDCSSIIRQHQTHSKTDLNFSLSKQPLAFDSPKITTPYKVALELFTLTIKLLSQRRSAQYVVLVFDKDAQYDANATSTIGRDDAIDIRDPRIHSLLPDIVREIAISQTESLSVHSHTLIIDGNNCSSHVASTLNHRFKNQLEIEPSISDNYDYPCILMYEEGAKYTIEHPDWQWSIQRASHTGGTANQAILYYLYMFVTEMDTIPNYDTYNIEIIGPGDDSAYRQHQSPLSQLLLIAVHNLRLYKTNKFKLHIHFKPLHCKVDIEMVKLHQLLCAYLLDNIYGSTLAFVFDEKEVSTYYQSRLTRENFVFTEFLMLTTLARLIQRPIETLIEGWVNDILESQPKELVGSFYQTYSMVAIDFNYKVVAVNTMNVALFVVSLLLSEDPKYKYKAYTGSSDSNSSSSDAKSNLTGVYYGAIEDAQDIYNIGMAYATVKSMQFNKSLDTSLSKTVLAAQWTTSLIKAVTEARGYSGFEQFWKLFVAPIIITSPKFSGNLFSPLWKSGDEYFLRRLFLVWLIGPRSTTAEFTSMKQMSEAMVDADNEITTDSPNNDVRSKQVSEVISEELWDVLVNVFDTTLIAPVLDRVDPYERIVNICKQCDPFTDKSSLVDTVTLNISSCRQDISQVLTGVIVTELRIVSEVELLSENYIPLLIDLMAEVLIDCTIVKFRTAIDSLPSTAFLSAENMKVFAQNIPKKAWWHMIDDIVGHTDYYSREHVRYMLYANDWGYGSKRLAGVPLQNEYYATSSDRSSSSDNNNAIHNADLDLIYNELDRARLPIDIKDNSIDESLKNNDQELPRLYRGWYDLKSHGLKSRQELLPMSRLYMGINSNNWSLPYYLREELTGVSGRKTAYSLPFKLLQLSPYPAERRDSDEPFVALERFVRVVLEKMPRFGNPRTETQFLTDSRSTTSGGSNNNNYNLSSLINGTAQSDARKFVNAIAYAVLGYRIYVPQLVSSDTLVPSFTAKELIFVLNLLKIVFRYESTEDMIRYIASLSSIAALLHSILDLKLLCGQDQWIVILWQYSLVYFGEIKAAIDSHFSVHYPSIISIPVEIAEYIGSFREASKTNPSSILLLTQSLRTFLICMQRDFVIAKNVDDTTGSIKMTHDSLKYLVHFGFDPLPKTPSSYTLTLAECNRAIEMTYDQVRDEAKDDLLDRVPRYAGTEAIHASHLLESVKHRIMGSTDVNNNNNNNTESRVFDVIKDDFDGSHRLVIRVAADGTDTTYKLEQRMLIWILRNREIIYLSQLLDNERYNWIDWFCSAIEDRQNFVGRSKEETESVLDGFERWTFTRRRFVDLTTDMKIVQLPYFDVIRNMPHVSTSNITQASQRTMMATVEWLRYDQQQRTDQRVRSIVLRENTQHLLNRMKINDTDTIQLPKMTDYIPCPWANWTNIRDPFLSILTGDCVNERLSDLRSRYKDDRTVPSLKLFPSLHGIYYEVYCVNPNLSTRDVDAMYLYGVRFGYNWCKKSDSDKLEFFNFLHAIDLVNKQEGGLIWKKPPTTTGVAGKVNLFATKKQQLPPAPVTYAVPYDTEAFLKKFLQDNGNRYRTSDWYSPVWDIGQRGNEETSEYANSILFQMDALTIPDQSLTDYANNRVEPHDIVNDLKTAFYRSNGSIDATSLLGDVKTVIYKYMNGLGALYSSWLSKWFDTEATRTSVYAYYDEMLLLNRYSALAGVTRSVTARLDAVYLLPEADINEIAGNIKTLILAHFDQLSSGVYEVSEEDRAKITNGVAALVLEYIESATDDIPIKMTTPQELYTMGIEVDLHGNRIDPQDKDRLNLIKELMNAKDPSDEQKKVSRVKMQRVIGIVMEGSGLQVDRAHAERIDAGEVSENLRHLFGDYQEGEDDLDRLSAELEHIKYDPNTNKRTKQREMRRVKRQMAEVRRDIAIGNRMVDIIVDHGENFNTVTESYLDMYKFLSDYKDSEEEDEEDSAFDQLVSKKPPTRSAPISPADKERKYRRTVNNLLHKQGSLELYFLFDLNKIPPHSHVLSKKAYIPMSNKVVARAGYSLLQSVIVALSGSETYDRKTLMKIADVAKLTQQTQNTLALMDAIDSIQDDDNNNNNNGTIEQVRKDALKRLYDYLNGKTEDVANIIQETSDAVNIEDFARQLASVCMVNIELHRINLIDARKGAMSYIKTTSINVSSTKSPRITLDILLYSYRDTTPPNMTHYTCEPVIRT